MTSRTAWIVIVHVLVCFFAVAAGAGAAFLFPRTHDSVNFVRKIWLDIPVDPRIYPGDTCARIRIIEIMSFSCGHCRKTHPVVSAAVRRLGRGATHAIIPYARQTTPVAPVLAQAVMAASSLQKADIVVQQLFTHAARTRRHYPPAQRDSVDRVAVNRIVRFAGIDSVDWKAAMADTALFGHYADIMAAIAHNDIHSTPALVINGYCVVGRQTRASLKKILDAVEHQRQAIQESPPAGEPKAGGVDIYAPNDPYRISPIHVPTANAACIQG